MFCILVVQGEQVSYLGFSWLCTLVMKGRTGPEEFLWHKRTFWPVLLLLK